MRYIAVHISLPEVGAGYQEIDADGLCARVTDADGNTVEAIEYHVTDAACERPAWGLD